MRKMMTLFLALSLLFSTCPVASALGESNADLYEEAMSLLREYKYTEAGEAFERLGGYGDAPRYMMYCKAVTVGELGLYSIAVQNLQSLSGFLDSDLLAIYYAGLRWESGENYEKAEEILSRITLYKDVSDRILTYPEKIHARDYRKADTKEQSGDLEGALKGFTDLGSYSDSADRAIQVQEKIHARDYAAADAAEQANELEKALEGFIALELYQDSADRAAAVREKICAAAYASADKAEKDGDYAAAYSGFEALGDYLDSKDRAAAVQTRGNYAQAWQYVLQGKFEDAYVLYRQLGDYKDSASKAYLLGVLDFAEVSDRKNGIAAFRMHDAWGLINMNTNTITDPFWDQIGSFNLFGLAVVQSNEQYGCINTSGEVIIPCSFDGISGFGRDGLCTVQKNKTSGHYLFGIYDKDGREITDAAWRTLGKSFNKNWQSSRSNSAVLNAPYFSDGKTKIQNENGLYGFMDLKGNMVGQVRWSSIRDFSENLAVVVENNKFGYIDNNGNVVIEPQYQDALSFSEGLAGVKTEKGWQFINRDNTVVIPARYAAVYSFSGGLADVYVTGKGWERIDTSGKLVYSITDQVSQAYQMGEELFAAQDWDGAAKAFEQAGDYEDAANKIREVRYAEGERKFSTADWEGAVKAFEQAGDYKDAANKIREVRYAEGETKFSEADWDGAVKAFEQAGDYKDAANKIREVRYAEGEAKFSEADWDGAVKAFEQAGEYEDAATLILETRYKLAGSLYESGDYSDALEVYLSITGYKDVEILLKTDKNLMDAIEKKDTEEVTGEGVISHAEFIAAENDTDVVIESYVQAHQNWWDNRVTVYLQGPYGAYFAYEMNCSEEDVAKLVPGQKIRVKGFKGEWSGEIEIVDGTFEFVEAEPWIAEAEDITALLGKEELADHMNEFVAVKGATVVAQDDGAAFAYKNPEEKTDDLYFAVNVDGQTYNFCVEFYLCGKDTDVYKAVEGLKVGDVVDLEGFLYWYNGANLQTTSLTVK